VTEQVGSRVFLLVEDFEMMRGVLRGHLSRCGAQRVDAAPNARDAINLLRKNKYDVVLCDYNLGPGKNGQMLLEEARHNEWISPAAVWIMITAEKSNDMVSVAAEQAPDDYLLKPITEATLQTRIQKLMERKASLAGIVSAMKAYDYRRALQLCGEQLAQGSKNTADVLRLQAQLYQLSGEADKARAVYEAILQRAPIPWAKLGLARLHLQAKKLTAARGLLEEIVRDHPQYLDAYDCLAEVLASQGQIDRELMVLQQAAHISPNSAVRQSALGHAALQQGNRDLAMQSFKRSIKLSEHSSIENPEPYLGLARAHSEAGAPAEALQVIAELRRKAESRDSRLLARTEELRAHQAAGNADGVAVAMKDIREHTQCGAVPLTPGMALRVAETLMQAGQRDDATQLLLVVTRNNHDDDVLLRRVQNVFDRAGMGEAGRELLLAARKQATESMSEGVRLMAQGKLTAAVEAMRAAAAAMPQNARVLLNFAAISITSLEKQGWSRPLEEEARTAIETARTLRPDDPRGLELLERMAKADPSS